MYNQTSHHSSHKYRAYANATMTVGKVRQIVMLYDGVIRCVRRAIEAIGQADYETRFNQLAKACEIINGLSNSLDYENGGEIAPLLGDYYASIDARLFTVHRTNSIEVCNAVIRELRMMRDAWDEIDQNSGVQPAPPVETHLHSGAEHVVSA